MNVVLGVAFGHAQDSNANHYVTGYTVQQRPQRSREPDAICGPAQLYTLTAYDRDNIVINQATAAITVGAVANSTGQLTGATKPRLITFNPALPAATRILLRYRRKGQINLPFTEVALNKLSWSGVFKFDASALAVDDYEYYYDAYDSANNLLARNNGYFRPD